jgi:hypothetical protein
MERTWIIRWCLAGLVLIGAPRFCRADDFPGPTDAKAQKTFADADQKLKEHKKPDAIEAFKKADKQDGHHCGSCAVKLISLGMEAGDNKLAVEYANELVSIAQSPMQTSTAHALRGIAEVREGLAEHKKNQFAAADQDLQAALAVSPTMAPCSTMMASRFRT